MPATLAKRDSIGLIYITGRMQYSFMKGCGKKFLKKERVKLVGSSIYKKILRSSTLFLFFFFLQNFVLCPK